MLQLTVAVTCAGGGVLAAHTAALGRWTTRCRELGVGLITFGISNLPVLAAIVQSNMAALGLRDACQDLAVRHCPKV